jgi:S1-C subfamily serine protease
MKRQLGMVVLGASLLLSLNFQVLAQRPLCDCAFAESGEFLTQDDPPESVDPAGVEDLVLLKHLMHQGELLTEQERIAEMGELIKQLQSENCQLDLPEPDSPLREWTEIYTEARKSVVVIGGMYKCGKCSRLHAKTASGFVITTTGAIVTNYHVVDDSTKKTLLVMTADGDVFPVNRVLAASCADDLAILKIDARELAPLQVATSAEAAPVAAPIGIISHPAHHFFSFTTGVVSRRTKIRLAGQEVDALFVTADYARGSSGAPVLNARGQVIGIVKSTDSVYYSLSDGKPQNLQMVFKICIPSTSLLKLVTPGTRN